mmetsp:Transcript_123191/g.213722  ORF Transcript_123191/g.213722 Transcript_123191/m.213722 type:complete len:144 (+) Transcript_123191:380-811(+)
MRHRQICPCTPLRLLMCQASIFVSYTLRVTVYELGKIPVVVALHLEVEDLGFARICFGNEMDVQQTEESVANTLELGFNNGNIFPRKHRLLLVSLPFDCSFCATLVMKPHAAHLRLTAFLNAALKSLRSSAENTSGSLAASAM